MERINMKTKIIPFDAEMAKDIQDGKIKGKIITKNKIPCKIVAYCNSGDIFIQRVTLESHCDWCYPYTRKGCYIDGHLNGGTDYDLVLEVPDNEPQESQFKPFDKVLVYNRQNGKWFPNFFSHIASDGRIVTITNSFYEIDEVVNYEGNEHLVGTTDKPKEV